VRPTRSPPPPPSRTPSVCCSPRRSPTPSGNESAEKPSRPPRSVDRRPRPEQESVIDPATAPAFPDLVPGTWNLRDIASVGGLRTGVLYRSATLQYLGPAGHRALRDLGITRVIDLRGPREIARDGENRLGDGIEQINIAFDGYVDIPAEYDRPAEHDEPAESDNQRLASLLADADAQAKLRAFFTATYVAMVRSPVAAAAIRQTLITATEADEPVLFH